MISQAQIEDSEGEVATIYGLSKDESALIARLQNQQLLFVPIQMLQVKDSERYSLKFSFSQLRAMKPNSEVLPVIEERPVIEKKQVETGRVKIKKTVSEKTETVEEKLKKEHYDIERVALNDLRDEPAVMRTEGDVTIIPVQEEILVVQKKILVREEIRIRKVEEVRNEVVSLKLRKENIEIDRKKNN